MIELKAIRRGLGRLVLAAAGICAAGCSDGSGNVLVPRPEGYPRIELYPPSYTVVSPVGGLSLEVNSGAVVDTARIGGAAETTSRWFNLQYPDYRAVIYCTYTPVDKASVASVLDNRRERMALNSGGLPGEIVEVENRNGVTGQLLVTPAGSVNPVQFLATDSRRFVLSGAMTFIGAATVDADSVAPVVDAVCADMIHMLTTLSWTR
ncbi:MAG: hypothetical protein K2L49_02155 [Muribaculaceae bacterium]|nr:hypothetical protein [Muribaculaceae bacterium]